MKVIDSQMTIKLFVAQFNTMYAVGCLIIIALTNYWFVVVVPPVIVYFALLYIYTRRSLIQLKKIQSQSIAPLLNHVGATVSGAPIIKAYNKVANYKHNLYSYLDSFNKIGYIMQSSPRWIGQRVELVGLMLATLLLVIIVSYKSTMSPDLAALAFVYATNIASFLCSTFNIIVEAEGTLESAETVTRFIRNIEPEAANECKFDLICKRDGWPMIGSVSFTNVHLRFEENQSFVLNNVTFALNGKSRLGVVGRTGAGKSTLIAALFRLTEIYSGSIMIDGIDIKSIGLNLLRTSLAIIPQESILFSETIRFNIDPYGICTDEVLWHALKFVELDV